MTTLNATENLAVLKRSADKPAAEELAVLEQMFGYFSFEPMPLERAEERLAARTRPCPFGPCSAA